MRIYLTMLILVGSGLVLAQPSPAQPGPSGPRGAEPAAGRPGDRARTFIVLRLAEELDLDDAEALRISRVMRDGEAKRGTLRGDRAAVEEEIRSLLAAGSPDASRLQEAVRKANEIDRQVALVSEESIARVQESLSLEKQAKLVLLRPQLQRQIRQAVVGRMRGDGPGRRPPGGARWGSEGPGPGPGLGPRSGSEPGIEMPDVP